MQHILSQLLLSWFLGKYISPIIINNKSKFIHITTSILLFLPWVVATYRFSFGLMYYFVSCLQYKPQNCQPVNPVIYPKHCLWKDKPFHFLDDFIIIKLWQMMPNEKLHVDFIEPTLYVFLLTLWDNVAWQSSLWQMHTDMQSLFKQPVQLLWKQSFPVHIQIKPIHFLWPWFVAPL